MKTMHLSDRFDLLTIKGTFFALKVCLEPVVNLLPHEEIVEELLTDLTNDLINCGKVRDPIVVDEETLTVLDGMHRLAALKDLGAKMAPVCLVPYSTETIRVERWIRIIRGNLDYNELVCCIGKPARRVKREDIFAGTRRSPCTGIVLGDEGVLVKGDSKMECYRLVSELERYLRTRGFDISYVTEVEALDEKRSLLIVPPLLEKRDVTGIARQKQLFPPKATRHIIPSRVVGLNVPLSLLKQPDSKQLQEFREEVLSRKVQRLPPMSRYGDRLYEEELFVLG